MEYKNNKKIIFLPLLVVVAIVTGFLLGLNLTKSHYQRQTAKTSLSGYMQPASSKLGTILNLIDTYYVDTVNVDTLTEELIPKLLEKLDPHSMYIPAKDVVAANENLEGEFEGIGIMFNMITDTVIVQSVIPGGPSEQAGIIGGDRIITVGDSLIAGQKRDQNEVMKMLRGKGGTTVKLGIERQGASELIPIEVVRGKIPIKSIEAAFMIKPGVGFVKLLQFSRTSHEELVAAVERLKNEGMKTLILDLTGNTGGFLDQAILIAQEFLPKDRLIVYTEGKGAPNMRQYADGSGKFIQDSVILMIDEGSASSSEIVAGALQDNDRGIIVGRRSFGKGLVQQQIPFQDGSVVNFTIARYHTPTGRCIQRPYDKGIEAYNNDIINRMLHKEFVSKDSIKLSDSLKYTTPKGKVVYGGGGIMPDVFVPIDTTALDSFTHRVLANNVLFRYVLSYTDQHRDELSGIKTMEQAESYFEEKMPQIYEGMITFARGRKIDTEGAKSVTSKKFIAPYLKAYIARNTSLDENGFYAFIYPLNTITVESLKIADRQQNQ